MRFLTLEEQEYAVGLPKRPPLRASQTMMTTADTMEMKENNVFEEGSVVSNLPLLFANGHPTSLEKITLVQLEHFVTFMVQCSLGHDTTDVITEPRWWPKEVKFSNPLTRPKRINENWMANLKKLVFRCYTYHRSEYLLRFCSYLARYPHDDLEYVNNWDSTTSLYHKSTGKLLVTFRNENMNYDKRYESPRKKLLSCNGVASCNSNKLKLQQQQQHSILMVEPPAEDIYLCDNCDAEFIGLEKMKEHERMCCEQEQTGGNSRSTTPDVSIAKPELKQDQFLEYFRLCSPTANAAAAEAHENAVANNNVAERSSRRVRGSINFARCSSIPFSSPAGILLAKKSKAMTEDTQQERLERIERHLVAPVLNSSSCRPKWLEAEFDNDRWIVTYKPSKEKVLDDYVHQYQFVNTVKRKPMLSIHSQLLYLACRPLYVLLTQLTQEQINHFNENPLKYKCVVDREPSTDPVESTAKTVENTTFPSVSSKRKAPSDENDSKSMEKSNDEILCNEASVGNLSLSSVTDYCCGENNLTVNRSIKETTFCTNTPNRITVIDLCSSDDEENSTTSAHSDENRNPLKFVTDDDDDDDDDDVTKSLLQNLSSTNFHLPTHPTDQTSGWWNERGNILNDSSETCTSKYRSTMSSSTRTNISPILRPAP